MPRTVYLNTEPPSLELTIQQATKLWHEESESRQGTNLGAMWESARHLLGDTGTGMTANEANLLILGGGLVPKNWKSDDAYAYAALFIAAFYIQEASVHVNSNRDAAWFSLSQGFYYLGIGSPPTTAWESANAAVRTRHDDRSGQLRALVIDILAELTADQTIRSAAQAQRRVADAIQTDSSHKLIFALFDKPNRTEADTPGAATERLLNRLVHWSCPSGPYPEVAAAFQPFKQKRRLHQS